MMKDLEVKKINFVLVAALIGASFGAFAHEGASHGQKKAATAVKKEQKDWGIAGDAKAAKRTIEISMTDNMRFSPDRIEVQQGETIKFVVKNSGKVMHEMVERVPLKRLGQPEDIANACLYLGSDEAQFVTGVCIEVDGARCV